MKAGIPNAFATLRRAVPFDSVSIGFSSIELFPVTELPNAQRGYGIVPEGDETDWAENWLVIGIEGTCGDPIFIDTDEKDYPVYTAAHGMGEWDPQLISSSFRRFIEVLERLRMLSRGRSNPVELEKKPITNKEREDFIEFVQSDGPDIDSGFWENFCGE